MAGLVSNRAVAGTTEVGVRHETGAETVGRVRGGVEAGASHGLLDEGVD